MGQACPFVFSSIFEQNQVIQVASRTQQCTFGPRHKTNFLHVVAEHWLDAGRLLVPVQLFHLMQRICIRFAFVCICYCKCIWYQRTACVDISVNKNTHDAKCTCVRGLHLQATTSTSPTNSYKFHFSMCVPIVCV